MATALNAVHAENTVDGNSNAYLFVSNYAHAVLSSSTNRSFEMYQQLYTELAYPLSHLQGNDWKKCQLETMRTIRSCISSMKDSITSSLIAPRPHVYPIDTDPDGEPTTFILIAAPRRASHWVK